jgi:hypothetical protein
MLLKKGIFDHVVFCIAVNVSLAVCSDCSQLDSLHKKIPLK